MCFLLNLLVTPGSYEISTAGVIRCAERKVMFARLITEFVRCTCITMAVFAREYWLYLWWFG